MKTAIVTIKGVAPYVQSGYHDAPKLEAERPDKYEERTWKEKGHWNQDNIMCIPPMALKKCLEGAARELGMKIAGTRGKSYKQAFRNGILITDLTPIGISKEKVEVCKFFGGAGGMANDGKRVWRWCPIAHQWQGTVTILVLNETITEPVFRTHFEAAGKFVGIGQNRPENGGIHGRFDVIDIKWK